MFLDWGNHWKKTLKCEKTAASPAPQIKPPGGQTSHEAVWRRHLHLSLQHQSPFQSCDTMNANIDVNIGSMFGTKYSWWVCCMLQQRWANSSGFLKASAGHGRRSKRWNKWGVNMLLALWRITMSGPAWGWQHTFCPAVWFACEFTTAKRSAGIQMLQLCEHRASAVGDFTPRSPKTVQHFHKQATLCVHKQINTQEEEMADIYLNQSESICEIKE